MRDLHTYLAAASDALAGHAPYIKGPLTTLPDANRNPFVYPPFTLPLFEVLAPVCRSRPSSSAGSGCRSRRYLSVSVHRRPEVDGSSLSCSGRSSPSVCRSGTSRHSGSSVSRSASGSRQCSFSGVSSAAGGPAGPLGSARAPLSGDRTRDRGGRVACDRHAPADRLGGVVGMGASARLLRPDARSLGMHGAALGRYVPRDRDPGQPRRDRRGAGKGRAQWARAGRPRVRCGIADVVHPRVRTVAGRRAGRPAGVLLVRVGHRGMGRLGVRSRLRWVGRRRYRRRGTPPLA